MVQNVINTQCVLRQGKEKWVDTTVIRFSINIIEECEIDWVLFCSFHITLQFRGPHDCVTHNTMEPYRNGTFDSNLQNDFQDVCHLSKAFLCLFGTASYHSAFFNVCFSEKILDYRNSCKEQWLPKLKPHERQGRKSSVQMGSKRQLMPWKKLLTFWPKHHPRFNWDICRWFRQNGTYTTVSFRMCI